MKIEQTHIGEYPEDNFRHKGLVIEAETKADSVLIELMLNNRDKVIEILKDEFVIIPRELTQATTSGLIMTVNGRDWVEYNREVHSQMTALGFKIEIKNCEDEK